MSTPFPADDWFALVRAVSKRFLRLEDEIVERMNQFLADGRSVLRSAESAILVPDREGKCLRFLASVNSRSDLFPLLRDIEVPIAGSIAGCVFSTGQLIAIANPDEFYQEVDRKTGLVTRIYLAAPIVDGDDTLGVLTFINRPAETPETPFNEQEIDASVRLAEVAAAQIRFLNRLRLQQKMLQDELVRIGARFRAQSGDSQSSGALWIRSAEQEAPPLARAMRCLEALDEHELELAVRLLRAVRDNRHRFGDLPGGDGS